MTFSSATIDCEGSAAANPLAWGPEREETGAIAATVSVSTVSKSLNIAEDVTSAISSRHLGLAGDPGRRHGDVIYRRFTSRHRLWEADGDAARHYLETQAPKQAAWAEALGFEENQLARESALIACVDTLSLALCGELTAPLSIEAPGKGGELQTLELVERPGDAFAFTLSPWPFRRAALIVEGEGLALPEGGRLRDEVEMRQWLKSGVRRPFSARLAPVGA